MPKFRSSVRSILCSCTNHVGHKIVVIVSTVVFMWRIVFVLTVSTLVSDYVKLTESHACAEVMAFSGAPEIINGRLAMLAFVAALGAELSTGETVLSQLFDAPVLVAVTAVVFSWASLVGPSYPLTSIQQCILERKDDSKMPVPWVAIKLCCLFYV